MTWYCDTLSAMVKEDMQKAVCKCPVGLWYNGRDDGSTDGQVLLLLANSDHAGSLLHAPVAQQVVRNELRQFVSLAGNSRLSELNGDHPQDRDWMVDIPKVTLM